MVEPSLSLFYQRQPTVCSQTVEKASEKAVRMIEPNLGVFIIETPYCMFTGSEKIQRKGSTNDRAKSRCFYNRDTLLYVQRQ
jgi:hypothetical protein